MTLLTTIGIGLERLARETCIILIDNLNEEIAVQQSEWEQLDKDLAVKRGYANEPIYLEQIELGNFHLGHKPSLLEAPIDKYPNVSVMAFSAAQGGEEQDHLDIYDTELGIEVLCKATHEDSYDPEEVVNRRTHRTIEAIHNVMQRNRNINGLVNDIPFPPSIEMSEVFIRRESTNYGTIWYWQGGRLSYVIQKPSGFS